MHVSTSGMLQRQAQVNAPVAQLDRASDYESEGRTFESFRVRQLTEHLQVFIGSVIGALMQPLHTSNIWQTAVSLGLTPCECQSSVRSVAPGGVARGH
jgi:hypothetical protein